MSGSSSTHGEGLMVHLVVGFLGDTGLPYGISS
jgi:hypothetical protein